jgi:hypothetical protein
LRRFIFEGVAHLLWCNAQSILIAAFNAGTLCLWLTNADNHLAPFNLLVQRLVVFASNSHLSLTQNEDYPSGINHGLD